MFIQNNKKIIQCDRCGNNFTTIANLRKHFNKKKIESIFTDFINQNKGKTIKEGKHDNYYD
jgi:hypothetical protein